MVEPFTFESLDGIRYLLDIRDIIQLDKAQRYQLRDQAATMTHDEILERGLEVILYPRQATRIMNTLRELTKGKTLEQLLKQVFKFSGHAEYDRMPDPSRGFPSKAAAVQCVVSARNVSKCLVSIDRNSLGDDNQGGKTREKLAYTILGNKGTGRGKVSLSIMERLGPGARRNERYILIITLFTPQ